MLTPPLCSLLTPSLLAAKPPFPSLSLRPALALLSELALGTAPGTSSNKAALLSLIPSLFYISAIPSSKTPFEFRNLHEKEERLN
jgi:hypothetical protein